MTKAIGKGRAGVLVRGSAGRLTVARGRTGRFVGVEAGRPRTVLRPTQAQTARRRARLAAHAGAMFGDPGYAAAWLAAPNPSLQGRSPLEAARTEAGLAEAMAVASRFAHGDYA